MKKKKLSDMTKASFSSYGLDKQNVLSNAGATDALSKLYLISSILQTASEMFFITVNRTEGHLPTLYLVSCNKGSSVADKIEVRKINSGTLNPRFFSKVENNILKIYLELPGYQTFSKSVISAPVNTVIPSVVYDDISTLTEIVKV